MPNLKTERKVKFYRCGRCKGMIRYFPPDGRPKRCRQCGYGHGERDVNDVPSEVKLNFSSIADESAGSRGISEQSTITSR